MNAGVRDLSIGEEEEEQRSQGPQSQPATSGQSRIIERDMKNRTSSLCALEFFSALFRFCLCISEDCMGTRGTQSSDGRPLSPIFSMRAGPGDPPW